MAYDKGLHTSVIAPNEADDANSNRSYFDPDSRGGENGWIRLMTWIRWYPREMPIDEKRLVLKLDLMILIYGCLAFFTKYLSQASLTNAYVT